MELIERANVNLIKTLWFGNFTIKWKFLPWTHKIPPRLGTTALDKKLQKFFRSTVADLLFGSSLIFGFCFCFLCLLNTLASDWFWGFSIKKWLNACGFAREYLRSYMGYGPGRIIKRHGKSSSLHSKTFFWLGRAGFLWVTLKVEDF